MVVKVDPLRLIQFESNTIHPVLVEHKVSSPVLVEYKGRFVSIHRPCCCKHGIASRGGFFFLHFISNVNLRNVVREKNGIMWEKFPSGGPPTPPVWEFSIFFTVFVKLVMPFYKLLNWKKQ